MSVQRTVALSLPFDCPTSNSPYFSIWNNHQNEIIMQAKDDSLWQIDYPSLNHLEQLTKPIKGLSSYVISSDDASIAFVAGLDVYLVDTTHKS